MNRYKAVLGAGAVCKNRDEQLTHIVRVSRRHFILNNNQLKYYIIF